MLTNDMGLGKTMQTLAFLLLEKSKGRLEKPALIVIPTSVLPNWEAELERFAPDLHVHLDEIQSLFNVPNSGFLGRPKDLPPQLPHAHREARCVRCAAIRAQ